MSGRRFNYLVIGVRLSSSERWKQYEQSGTRRCCPSPKEEIDELESGEEDFYLEQDHEADSIYGFVYLIRNGDLCKIGITENFLRRIDQLKPDEVLNVVRCENFKELEKDLHSFFKDVRLPQTEYFRLSREQINKAHKLMTSLARF